jgi:SAM-dependent methyltransferase
VVDHAGQRSKYGNRIWSPREGYDIAAPFYDDWYWKPFWQRNELPEVQRLLEGIARVRLSMDLGCGTGMYCDVLAKLGHTIGVDPSVGMLRIARSHVSAKTWLAGGRASALPLAEKSLDLSVAARSLSHEVDLPRALHEVAYATRPGGLLIISDVHAEHDYPRTRIPIGSEDIHIETIKRTPREIGRSVAQSGNWEVEFQREYRWRDLTWAPDDERFIRLDRRNLRPIFFMLSLRRRGATRGLLTVGK